MQHAANLLVKLVEERMDIKTHRSLSQPQLGGAVNTVYVCVCVFAADSTTAEE